MTTSDETKIEQPMLITDHEREEMKKVFAYIIGYHSLAYTFNHMNESAVKREAERIMEENFALGRLWKKTANEIVDDVMKIFTRKHEEINKSLKRVWKEGDLYAQLTSINVRLSEMQQQLASLGSTAAPPIPESVYYSRETNDFYNERGAKMGSLFFHDWRPRWNEFPQSLDELKNKQQKCHCAPGPCMAPKVMGVQMTCLDPARARGKVPSNVYYSAKSNNFYNANRHAMGYEFFVEWIERRTEFAQSLEELKEKPKDNAIPKDVYWNTDLNRFYTISDGRECDASFQSEWIGRKYDFPHATIGTKDKLRQDGR